MVYVTVQAPEIVHQMTLDELFSGVVNFKYCNNNGTNTVTRVVDKITPKMSRKVGVDTTMLVEILRDFNERYDHLRVEDMHTLYREFYIPKKSKGYRKIDAPNEELSDALRELKIIFETRFNAMYHTSAFAYVKGRCTLDAIKRHQHNNSRWFGKYDLSNFFGSTTLDFVMSMLAIIYPFSEVMKTETGKTELKKAISLGFLDGGLPQGTPLSPTITNIIMIPIDYSISKRFHERDKRDKQRFIYTRYADDFLVSSEYNFNVRDIENDIREVLKAFGAPYTMKPEKTRYGSSAGQNWNLGLMLNKDNEITVGHKKKRQLKAAINSFIMDMRHGHEWDLLDLQILMGNINYCRSIERTCVDEIIAKFNNKYQFDTMGAIKLEIGRLTSAGV